MCTSVSWCGAGGSNDFGESFREVGRNRSHSRHEGAIALEDSRRDGARLQRAGQQRSGHRDTVARAEVRRWTTTSVTRRGLVWAGRGHALARVRYDQAPNSELGARPPECSAGTPTRTSQVSADRPATPVTEVHRPSAVHVRSVSSTAFPPPQRGRKGAIEHPARTNYCDALPAMAGHPSVLQVDGAFLRWNGPPGNTRRAAAEFLRVVRPTSWRAAERAGCAGIPTPLANPAARNATAHPPRC